MREGRGTREEGMKGWKGREGRTKGKGEGCDGEGLSPE